MLPLGVNSIVPGRYIDWILLVFPLWVLFVSIYILIDNLRRPSQTAGDELGQAIP